MQVDQELVQSLIDSPTESLAVELKRWLDPDQVEGKAKIVKAALALRNNDGGYLLIGFDDTTHLPDPNGAPESIETAFHTDKIQALVSRYASEVFEVAVAFPRRSGQLYPVIVVPPGIRTPVAAKCDLETEDGSNRKLIATNDVYIRTLNANHTVSSSKAGWSDWPRIMEICLDNREANIGRFIRRHLGGTSAEMVREALEAIQSSNSTGSCMSSAAEEVVAIGAARFQDRVAQLELSLPQHGAWEVSLAVRGGGVDHRPNEEFLNLLHSSNPGFTGWPVWLTARDFVDPRYRPYIFEGAWERLIVSPEDGPRRQIDFARFEPAGRFYQRRAFEDDLRTSPPAPAAGAELDFVLPVVRTAEAIAVGLAFARAMGYSEEAAELDFAFRWSGLGGRILTSWVQPMRHLHWARRAEQGTVMHSLRVPIDTPTSAIGAFVATAVRPLFELFEGFQLADNVVEELTLEILRRRG